MIPQNENRRDRITDETGHRDQIRAVAADRNQRNFGRHLCQGPFGGTRVVNNTSIVHAPNADEQRPDFAGTFSKGLEHDPSTGLVDNPRDCQVLLDALDTVRTSESFPDPNAVAVVDTVPRASSVPEDKTRPFVNPVAGAAAGIYGIDAYDMTIRAAPGLDSRQAAIELVELYWMALMRDIPFDEWDSHPLASEAVRELDALNKTTVPAGEEQFAAHYRGDGSLGTEIDLQRLFRGSAPGDDAGAYISQLLIKDIPYGTLQIEQKQHRLKSTRNYMDDWEAWLNVQNGYDTSKKRGDLEDVKAPKRHIVTLRDLAHYVRFDALHEAYFNAALILLDAEAPLSEANPYTRTGGQEGFGTYGGPHLLVAVTEAATRALHAVWHQKWMVHRRLRPEAMGARAELQRANKEFAFVDDLVLESDAAAKILSRQANILLSQAFPEGSPMHPSYGAGHATVAGACTTILKAFFETDAEFPAPKTIVTRPDGSTKLVDSAESLTVGGEINKLAANIAIGRDGAGVHYRSDYTKSMSLGEAVALGLLQEQAMAMKEGTDPNGIAFRFENFSGQWIDVLYSGEIAYSAGYAVDDGAQSKRSSSGL